MPGDDEAEGTRDDRPIENFDASDRMSAETERSRADVRPFLVPPEAASLASMIASGLAGQIGRAFAADMTGGIGRMSGLAWRPEFIANLGLGIRLPASYQSAAAAVARHAASLIDVNTVLPNYRGLLAKVLPAIERPDFAEMFRRFQPANWSDALDEDVHMSDLVALAREGWPTAWVPAAGTLRALVRCEPTDRSKVLDDCCSEVLVDCEAALVPVSDGPYRAQADLLGQAIRAIRAGLPAPAQAMAANVLDTMIRASMSPWMGYKKWLQLHPDDEDFTMGQLRYVVTMAPVRLVLEDFWEDDPVPAAFNRHATAHAAGEIQYTDANAVVGVLLAVSIVREFHEQSAEEA